MVGIEYRVRLGRPQGIRRADARLSAAVSQLVAAEAVRRVQRRVNHPAARALRARGTNQWSATISGPRGGPGPIVPVRARALRFDPGGGVIFRARVNGAGLGPLIEAETSRVRSIAINLTL